MTAERCGSTADPAEPLSDAELLIGLVVSPSLSAVLGPEVTTSVRKILVQRYPGVRWQLKMAEDRLVDPPTETLDLLEAARNRVLEKNWDLAVVLTEIPLKTGRRPVLTQLSPVHGVGLVSVPTLGPVHVRQKVQETTVHVVGQLLGYDAEDLNAQRDLARRAHQLSTDLDERPDDNVVQFTARVLSGNVRLLLGMIRANQPWAFVARLSRAMVVAAATGMLTLVASDLWVLAMAYGPVRLVLLAVMAIGAVSATLILGADLWERPRRRAQREQVILFNLATTATVAIGVVVFLPRLIHPVLCRRAAAHRRAGTGRYRRSPSERFGLREDQLAHRQPGHRGRSTRSWTGGRRCGARRCLHPVQHLTQPQTEETETSTR